jgi:hypothetical protein
MYAEIRIDNKRRSGLMIFSAFITKNAIVITVLDVSTNLVRIRSSPYFRLPVPILLSITGMRSGVGTRHHANAFVIAPRLANNVAVELLRLDSGIRQQRRHHCRGMVMGDPGLLQKLPDIAALLFEGGGDRQQSPAADSSLA